MDISLNPETLYATLGTAKAPQLVDVCIAEDVARDPYRVPGARALPHRGADCWASTLDPDRDVLVICHKGLKLSQGVAAQLRAMGIKARHLEGGNVGWAQANMPRIRVDQMMPAGTPYIAGLPQDPHALARQWVVNRWIDATAPVWWVPEPARMDVAARFDAVTVPQDLGLAPWVMSLGLSDDLLGTFLQHIDRQTWPYPPLLDALPQLHGTAEEVAEAALPILDAAWIAHRKMAR